MEPGLRGGLLTADFLTQSYRISAQVAVRNRRLINILSDAYRSLLELYDVYISRITRPGDIVTTYPTAVIAKSSIVCVVLPAAAGVLSKNRSYAFGKVPYDVFITVPSFEIRGRLMSAGKLDLNMLLSTATERFLPIMAASAAVSFYPQISFSGELLLINKERIELFCVREPG
jgi:hypothetical protein